jgi:hypothetical protein
MAWFNPRRIFKSSIPIGTFTFFVLLVTFHLYHRPIALGNLQHLGWQAHDIVAFGNVTVPSGSKPAPPPTRPSNESTDWWNVEDNDPQPVSTSFRLDIWNPLTPHRTGSGYHILLVAAGCI